MSEREQYEATVKLPVRQDLADKLAEALCEYRIQCAVHNAFTIQRAQLSDDDYRERCDLKYRAGKNVEHWVDCIIAAIGVAS